MELQTLDKIKENDFNLNISRYVSTAKPEKIVNLKDVNSDLNDTQKDIQKYTVQLNRCVKTNTKTLSFNKIINNLFKKLL